MELSLEFERPIAQLEKRLQDLRELDRTGEKPGGAPGGTSDFSAEIALLEKKVTQLLKETYSQLTPWQRVQVARHPNRPYTRDYIEALFPDFMELHGDRTFGDDQAILGGVATWEGEPILILGHQKGRSTKQKMERNFGMARPEGYRKAVRLLKLAERSHWPILTLIDTPGAFPGIDAEERGQSCAIAESIEAFFGASVPIMTVVIGEGGSGGALAIAIADQIVMLEHSIYSVISPESCASILWSDASLAEKAAERIKMSAGDLLKFGIIDQIMIEPIGGAHRDWTKTFELLKANLKKTFSPMVHEFLKNHAKKTNQKDYAAGLIQARLEKFRDLGNWAVHPPQTSKKSSRHESLPAPSRAKTKKTKSAKK